MIACDCCNKKAYFKVKDLPDMFCDYLVIENGKAFYEQTVHNFELDLCLDCIQKIRIEYNDKH